MKSNFGRGDGESGCKYWKSIIPRTEYNGIMYQLIFMPLASLLLVLFFIIVRRYITSSDQTVYHVKMSPYHFCILHFDSSIQLLLHTTDSIGQQQQKYSTLFQLFTSSYEYFFDTYYFKIFLS